MEVVGNDSFEGRYAGKRLGVKVVIVVPETTPEHMYEEHMKGISMWEEREKRCAERECDSGGDLGRTDLMRRQEEKD